MTEKVNQGGIADSKPQIKKDRIRSPNYPPISLRKAVSRAEELYDAYKYSQVPVKLVHENWNLTVNGSAGSQTVAALKTYGLIDIEGDGDKRVIRLSERAKKILGQHRDRQKLLQESALSPSIYAELWKKYSAEGGLPADKLIIQYLVFDREAGKFNETYVANFIADFRDTIAFAKLAATDIIANGGEDSAARAIPDNGDNKLPANAGINALPSERAGLPQDRSNMLTDTFTLEEGPVVLQYPKTLSSSSFEDFKTWTELQLRKIQRSIKNDAPPKDEEKK